MKRSINWTHILIFVFMCILLAGMCLMLYDTIIHDNDTGMIVTVYIITAVLFIAVVYLTHAFIMEFVVKERRRKTQRDLAKEMRIVNDDPHYKGDRFDNEMRYVDSTLDVRFDKFQKK